MTLHSFINEFLAAVEPVVVGFAVALFTVGTLAVYNWGRLRGLQVQVKALGAGAATTIVAVPPAGAGTDALMPGQMRRGIALAAPIWNQLDDPLPDGALDPQAATDCGEESVAMAIAACGGPPLPAGVLRQILGGPSRAGPTTAAALSYLLTLFGIRNHIRQASADAAWVEWQHSYQAHYLVLALGYWVTPGYPHWVLVRQTDSGAVLFNDPWGGEVRTVAREEAQKLYMGVYVHLDQPVAALAAAPPAA